MDRGARVVERLKGPVATLPVCFTEDGEVHFSAMKKYVDWLCDQGVSTVLLTYGYSQFAWLSDDDIWRLTADLAGVIAGRCVFIASTGWWPPKQCREFLKHADGAGVDTVKVQINPWLIMPGGTDEKGAFFRKYHDTIQDAATIPLTLWCNYFGTPAVPVDVIAEMAKDPQIIACKNDDHPFYYYYDLIRATRDEDFAVISGGQMRNFVFGYQVGSPAYLSAVVDFRPENALEFYDLLVAGRIDDAWQWVYRYEEPCFKLWMPLKSHRWIHAVMEMHGLYPNRLPGAFDSPLTDEECARVRREMEEVYGPIKKIEL